MPALGTWEGASEGSGVCVRAMLPRTVGRLPIMDVGDEVEEFGAGDRGLVGEPRAEGVCARTEHTHRARAARREGHARAHESWRAVVEGLGANMLCMCMHVHVRERRAQQRQGVSLAGGAGARKSQLLV
jgi:hypothetical protein